MKQRRKAINKTPRDIIGEKNLTALKASRLYSRAPIEIVKGPGKGQVGGRYFIEGEIAKIDAPFF
jgi:hypothetical protein